MKKKKNKRANATWERRRTELDKLKSVAPSYNGWWYYEYFKDFLHGNNK